MAMMRLPDLDKALDVLAADADSLRGVRTVSAELYEVIDRLSRREAALCARIRTLSSEIHDQLDEATQQQRDRLRAIALDPGPIEL